MHEEWFTVDDIQPTENSDKLYCISVDSPEKQFLAGRIGVPTHNTEEGKEEDAAKGEAAMIIGSIARLGRAAGVHLVIATQRPDANIIAGETKANLGVRINCGRTDSNASSMILGTADGTRVKSQPRGRLYLRIFGSGNHGQGFFAKQEWIDEYLESQGLNPDGTPLTKQRSQLANLTDFSTLEGADLDSQMGLDNEGAIERIRQQEADGTFENLNNDTFDDDDFDNDNDVDFDDDDEDMINITSQKENIVDDDDSINEDLDGDPDSTGYMGRPVFETKEEKDRWHRPEDDWSSELEALIEENFKANPPEEIDYELYEDDEDED